MQFRIPLHWSFVNKTNVIIIKRRLRLFASAYFSCMYKTRLFLFLALMPCCALWSQKKVTVSGSIKDAKNGEVLTGAVVYAKSNPQNGASANAYGFYSLTLSPGK